VCPDVDGGQNIGKVFKPAMEVWPRVVILPAFVAARQGPRLAGRPPGPPCATAPARPGGTPPLALEVRLDAVAAVLLDGLSYRRAGRMVGISKTEVGDSMDLLLGPLADLGFCQPDGTFITTLEELGRWLGEMAQAGEAVCIDGLGTRVQRPRSWANQKLVYDAKRHTHTAQGLAVSTIWGDLLWVDGGWPGSCHERELIQLAGLAGALDDVEVASLLDRGFRGLAKLRQHWHTPVGDRRTKDRLTQEQRAFNRLQAGLRAGGAVDRPPGRRLGAASLARAAVPRPGRLPRRRGAHLPWPLAPPSPHMTEASWTPWLNDQVSAMEAKHAGHGDVGATAGAQGQECRGSCHGKRGCSA
jgi:DDE superfamily endonuclease